LQQAFDALPPEEQQAVVVALQFLQGQQGGGNEDVGEK